MTNPIGQLLSADEQLTHQVADTFAVVGTSDPSWTEKICAMAMARDGSLQIGFGLGKYPNRNVMDGYAATSRGPEQITVRASRRLASQPEVTAIGPIHYEVIEPLRVVRFRLDENDCQPIAFDWTFEAAVPAFVEERSHVRAAYRTTTDLVRYHQTGVASGWVSVDGERFDIDPDTWVSTRDHSWGVRYDVGKPAPDMENAAARIPAGVGFMMIWSPTLLERADGSRYALHLHFLRYAAPGFAQTQVIAGVEHPDGRHEPIVGIDVDAVAIDRDPTRRRDTRLVVAHEIG